MKNLSIQQYLKIYKIYVVSTTILFLLIALGLLGYFVWALRFSPTFHVLDLEVSNLTDRSATISWLTQDPMTGTIRFVGDTNLTTENNRQSSKIHAITVSGLKPFKEYKFYVTNSFGRKIRQVNFMTLPHPEEVKLPVTVYGKIRQSDGQPSADTLVVVRRIFLGPVQESSESVSAFTNSSGNYLIDLSNAFLIDSKVIPNAEERLEFKIWTKDGKYKEYLLTKVQTQPIPEIKID